MKYPKDLFIIARDLNQTNGKGPVFSYIVHNKVSSYLISLDLSVTKYCGSIWCSSWHSGLPNMYGLHTALCTFILLNLLLARYQSGSEGRLLLLIINSDHF